MFAYLVGKIADISEDNLVLEVNHIGFNIKIPSSLHSSLPGIGEEIKIHTYTCVREDSFQLYGFLTRDDLDMFRLLITVNGIGPKGDLPYSPCSARMISAWRFCPRMPKQLRRRPVSEPRRHSGSSSI